MPPDSIRSESPLPDDVVAGLRRMSLLLADAEPPIAEALAGGVSSDIWRIELPRGPICVKRALSKLRVAADWRAPVSRNAAEAAWMRIAAQIDASTVPTLIAEDAEAGMFAMEYLSPGRYPPWKDLLRQGVAEESFAALVGTRLGRIHARTARDDDCANEFANEDVFHAIRLDPYLLATARAHPDLGGPLNALVQTTASTRLALMHGDISPKNILAGPEGPVFLDAECACFGDPAFDLAFCLNHLLLKCVWVPRARAAFLACFESLRDAYLDEVRWEPAGAIDARTARLLPGLLLARVDGKSPVEYITEEADRARVRSVAIPLLREPAATLAEVARVWRKEFRG